MEEPIHNEAVTGRRKLHNGELQFLSSPNIVRTIISRMREM